ncbi:uncharacterized protein [Atheta coriaria]|uniref:uncharacterized protein n=1 Tax=Dalotia coriaria TaxID=877792 RepID=UPI0031F3B33D
MDNKNLILKGPPLKEPLYQRSVGIRLFESLQFYAGSDKIAFLDVATNTKVSYKELFEITVKVAINLKKLGFSGKTIGVCSENRADFFIPVIAALYIGCPVTTINHGYTERELLYACELVKPSFVFCSKRTYASFKNLRAKQPMKYLQQLWILENLQKFYGRVKHIEKFTPVDVNVKEHIAGLLFSSGTTGLPKAVMITHQNLSCVHGQFFDKDHLLSEICNYLLCLPFYHGYGFNVALASLLKGNTVKFIEKFDPVVFLSAIEKYKVNYLTLVPPLMVFFAKHPLVEKYDLSSIKIIVCAAAACSKELENAVLTRLNNIPLIYQGYGLTESTLSIISIPNGTPPKEGTVGTVDPGIEIKIRNPETDKTLGPNEVGEICARGDTIMKGYYGNPVATRDTITHDRWLLTGDLGYYDKDGYIYIVDRLKELIKFKGFQVPPAELEALLLTHPKVMDAAVVGLPDDTAGELPLAFVVKKPGVQLNEQEIKDFIKEQVSYAKQLHGGVRFVEAIPKSAAGKILRRQLRDMLKKSKL